MRDRICPALCTIRLACLLTMLLCLPAFASAQTAELRGSVSDPSGGALPGAMIGRRRC